MSIPIAFRYNFPGGDYVMAKCINCGKNTLVRGHVKLADAAICTPCFKSLGFKLSDVTLASMYRYEDIKDGKDAYYSKQSKERSDRYNAELAEKYRISTKHYKQLDAAGSTDNEIKIFAAICAVLEDEGYDTTNLNVTLADDNSLFVLVGDAIMLQYKSEPDVKWIRFLNESNEKIRIGGSRIINSMAPRIVEAYRSAIG